MEKTLKQLIFGKASGISKLLLLTFCLCYNAHALARQDISIAITDSRHQKAISKVIISNLNKNNINADVITIDSLKEENNRDILIGIGDEANLALNQNTNPSRQLRIITSITPDHKDPRNRSTYLSMTQAVCQQLNFINAIDAQWKKIGILLQTSNQLIIEQLQNCAQKYNQNITPIIITQYINIIDALNANLPGIDALLALPDPNVYNAKTIKGILLTTYRHRKPLIGFSESFVRAGALAAIHTPIEQLGKQAAEITMQIYQDNSTQQYIYPEYFDIAINYDVAKSLKINIPDRKVLIEKMNQIP
ncbi:MAG: hypothetical protein OEZ15_01380 [Gammaproteobacteria bacterium]|nr:hypothetical protein [Gammaproteobacteria bacterium]